MSSADLNATAASLLGFLHKGPLTGWDLVAAVEISVGNFWNVTRSQVYRELKTLAAAGLVADKASGARDKVPYAITAKGRTAFHDWIARPPTADLLRLPIVLTVFFGRHVEPAILQRYLAAALEGYRARLDEYVRMRPEVVDDYHRATLDLGIAYERTMIAWLEGLPWLADGKRAKKGPRSDA